MSPKKHNATDEKIKQGLNSSSNRTAIILSLIALFAAIFTSFFNYFMIEKVRNDMESKKISIEDKKSRMEEIRLMPEFTRLCNEIRPKINCSCEAFRLEPAHIRVECKFENKGTHRSKIIFKGIELFDAISQKIIDDAINKTKTSPSLNTQINTVPSDAIGTNTFDIWFTPVGEQIKNAYDIRFGYEYIADEQALDLVKRLSGGYIKQSELKGFATQPARIKIDGPK